MRLLGRAGSVALVGGLGLAHLVGLGLQLADLPKANVIALVAESVVFAGIAGLVLAGRVRFSLATVLAVAALLRLTVFLPPPYHSTDAYRYVWDGRVQAAGINPYRYLPSDPALASLRDGTIWPRINRADYAPTIYPPV
ncbi:MAG: hypothetical protein JO048_11835, partial [Methylobacteriaceae bacterium]|nr:hypothetical protein [Methylobacteriaceae bacterium]